MGHFTSFGHAQPSSSGHCTSFDRAVAQAVFPPVYKSRLKRLGRVTFPEWTGERVYMVPFRPAYGLPAKLARWQPTVDQMLKNVEAPGDVYLMIDQSVVKAGESQRRPGVHIDGNWVGERQGMIGGYPETLILASDVVGCAAYTGTFSGEIGPGGDVSHLDLSKLKRTVLKAGVAYAGNVTMVHESIMVEADCRRTLVRLNVPDHEI